mgnify:CR=1 FL=1
MKTQYLTLAFAAPIVSIQTNAITPNENCPTTTTDKPNVIIIYADDLGYGDLECYGAKNIQTPNVNRLAKEGIQFTDAHAVAATSTPSRYSLLTGEYAWRKPGTDVAAGNAGMIISPGQFTLADMFKHLHVFFRFSYFVFPFRFHVPFQSEYLFLSMPLLHALVPVRP